MEVIHGGHPGNLTAVVTPHGVEDRFGDPTATGSSWTVHGCLLAPRDTSSEQFRATTGISDFTLFTPLGFEFPLAATVEVGGITAEVAAPSQNWHGSGQVVPLRRITG